MNIQLGNKSGIVGILLAALGLGGGTFGDALTREFAPPKAYETYETRQAVETLQEAVDRLAQVITTGQAVTTRIKDNVELIRRQAGETAAAALGDAKEQVLQTRGEVVATVQESIRAVAVKAISGLAGVVGIFLSAAGFREERPQRGHLQEGEQ